MKLRINNVIYNENDTVVFSIMGKTPRNKYSIGSVLINGDDEVIEIHIHHKSKDVVTDYEKLDYLNDWIIEKGYKKTPETKEGIRCKVRNKETGKHEKALIKLEDFRFVA